MMTKVICIATAAWLITVAPNSLGHGQGEKEPAKALIELGADVRHDLPFKSVYRAFLDDQFHPGKEKVLRVWIEPTWKGSKVGLENLAKLPNLHGVSFQSGSEQSDWYQILTKLPHLRQFCSIGESVDDRCCEYLSSCKDLDTLSVVGSSITPAGMEKLKGLNKLEWVSLKSAAKLGNSGFAHLPVKNLIYLNLEGTRVAGDGIASLSEAQHLQFLTVSGESLVATGKNEGMPADAGLKHLRKLMNLRRLQVGSMTVNEADMKEILRQSTHLQKIESHWGEYTRKGWKEGHDLAERLKRLEELRKKLQKPQ
jgi:hypothetical protein